jgi:HEPN domain-containing protein
MKNERAKQLAKAALEALVAETTGLTKDVQQMLNLPTKRSILRTDIQDLRDLLELITAATYPEKTLTRRLGLLTKEEKKKVNKKLAQVYDLVEEVDEIISNRAEEVGDKWP